MNAPVLPTAALDAHALTELVPPDTLAEARARRDALSRLLGRERAAAADFLLALADFDRRRGWERLGHASLFAFLTRELALSKGAAYLRLTAARLLPRFPAVEDGLRTGRLCLSAVGDLARVLSQENQADVLPRFFGCSSREAREVAAALLPCPSPARREVVTLLPAASAPPLALQDPKRTDEACLLPPAAVLAPPAAAPAPRSPAVRAHEPASTHPGRDAGDAIEPLTADLRRLHVTVSARLLEKVAAARNGLSHALPAATTAQVLEAALDLLLEKQARAKALVRRPRVAAGRPADAAAPRAIPAEVERAVRLRDGDRCQHPLDAGGTCGSTWKVELDHVVPVALGGPGTVGNLRCACSVHNRRAAEEALGPTTAGARRRRRPAAS